MTFETVTLSNKKRSFFQHTWERKTVDVEKETGKTWRTKCKGRQRPWSSDIGDGVWLIVIIDNFIERRGMNENYHMKKRRKDSENFSARVSKLIEENSKDWLTRLPMLSILFTWELNYERLFDFCKNAFISKKERESCCLFFYPFHVVWKILKIL